MKNKIGNSAKLLISSDLIHVLTTIFIDTFLVAYFLNITNENLSIISLYYIIVFSLRFLCNFILGKIVKKYPKLCNKILSIGITIRALFILLIVLLGKLIAKYFIIIAIIYAISETLYWCSHEIIYVDVTTKNNRKKYMSIKKILSKIVNIIAPIILGTSIELYSFIKISIYVFILSLIQIILTLLIKNNNDNKTSKEFNYIKFLKYIKDNNITKIKTYNLSGISYGIVENIISTIIIVITLMTFKTTFNLGILSTIFAIISMIPLLFYNKYYNKNNAIFILTLVTMMVLISVFGILIEIKKSTLVIFNFAYIIAFTIYDVIYNTRKGNLVNECNIEEYKEEFIIYLSNSVLIGRIIGYTLMLIVSFTSNILIFKILLVLCTILTPVFSYLIYKTEFNKKNK